MKYGYTMLTDGRCSDWGQCLLVDKELGEVIKGEKNIDELPDELLIFLIKEHCSTTEDLEGLTNEELKKILEEIHNEIYNTNDYDSSVYNYLCNAIYGKETPYIIRFYDIGQLANYVRENNIEIVENLLY